MKFLVDEALSPAIADQLRADGYDAKHVRDDQFQGSSDEVVFAKAALEDRVIVSADTDFAMILALRQEDKPSLILLRLGRYSPPDQVRLIRSTVKSVEQSLSEGAVVVIEPTRVRIRPLPIVED